MTDGSIQIGTRCVKANARPYIIAEIGVNHDGSVDRACAMIDEAANAGADAVKFQYFQADALISRAGALAGYQRKTHASSANALLRPLELSITSLQQCLDRAHDRGLHAVVTIFSIEHVEAIADMPWDAFKTASPDIINRPLIDAIVHFANGRPLLISTGAAEVPEIKRTIAWMGTYPHALLHCVSSYPTPLESSALGAIRAIQCLSPRALGYSDHTCDTITGALAVAAGARILEKHFTWNRDAPGPDHAASLNAQQLAEYVMLASRAFDALGSGVKECQAIERDVQQVSRQSIVTMRAMSAGHVLERDDMTIKRPGTGIPPHALQSIIGTTLTRHVDADMPLMPADVGQAFAAFTPAQHHDDCESSRHEAVQT